jgi:hypothetical protein
MQRTGLSTPEGEESHRLEIRRKYLSANCRNKIELFFHGISAQMEHKLSKKKTALSVIKQTVSSRTLEDVWKSGGVP